MDRSNWPQDTIDLENEIVRLFSSTLTTEELKEQESAGDDASGSQGPSGQVNEPAAILCTADTISRRRGWEVDLTTRLNALGVTDWRTACEWGQGVKVGIIDWAFSNLNDDPNLPRLDVYHPDDNPEGNALCQNVRESTWPSGNLFGALSNDCEPLDRTMLYEIDHGVNIAEIVKDIAPRRGLQYSS